MKVNKKGFVATSVLYCLAAIMAMVIFFIIANVKVIRDYTRISSKDIKEQLNGTIYDSFNDQDEISLYDGNVLIADFYVVGDSDKLNSRVDIISQSNISIDDASEVYYNVCSNYFITGKSGTEYKNKLFSDTTAAYIGYYPYFVSDNNNKPLLNNSGSTSDDDGLKHYCRVSFTINKNDFVISKIDDE